MMDLRNCIYCPRHCGSNRTQGIHGYCEMDALCKISYIGLHFGEEPPISGTQGSGTIFFTGCNLRCVFCQNYQISQEHQGTAPLTLSPEELAKKMIELQEQGAHNINFVSPSHMLVQMAEAIQIAKTLGLTLPIVYNSNGYEDLNALRQLKGLIDIYLPDCKYADNELGRRYSDVPDYADVIGPVIKEMLAQVGHLHCDENGIATRGLLVRHLVLPACLDNSRACLDLLASCSCDLHLSIMSQYSPQYKAKNTPPLNRCLQPAEYDAIIDYALDLGLDNAFIQEMESQDHYLPDFDTNMPFSE